jgi:hypothetical protein
MPHSPEETARMADAMAEWLERSGKLTTDLIAYPYTQVAAREMSNHGASRRLRDLDHCMSRVFEYLPPDIVAPEREAILDATMFIQAFVMNIYGAIDNLAWIWAYEKPVLGKDGETLPATWVGFRPKNKALRDSVSEETRSFLEGIDDWFSLLESFRDALAHRIPLYVPFLTLSEEAQREFKALEAEVMANGWSIDNWNLVMGKMHALGKFEPLMTHSLFTAPRVPFHQQMICDLATVVALGELILADLQRLKEAREAEAPRE